MTESATDRRQRLALLGDQGQKWVFRSDVPKFERAQRLLDPPMEVTIAILRGLRMVDETVVVLDQPGSEDDG